MNQQIPQSAIGNSRVSVIPDERVGATSGRQSATEPSRLPGWISTFHINYRGKRLGPYHRRCWKVNGKLKMEYVKPHDLERVRAACQAHRDRRKRRTSVARDFYNRIGNIFYLERMAKRLLKGNLRPEDYAFCEVIERDGITATGRPKLRMFNRIRPQYPIPNTQDLSQSFMYPSATNFEESPINRQSAIENRQWERFWKETRKDFIAIKKQMLAKETEEEKWTRWHKQQSKLPSPRPVPGPELPDWITEQRIEELVTELVEGAQDSSCTA